jgi:hypothetical protein
MTSGIVNSGDDPSGPAQLRAFEVTRDAVVAIHFFSPAMSLAKGVKQDFACNQRKKVMTNYR